MIAELEIENFRCFSKLKVPLKPLTVLIGENDTGKSSFLEAIDRLGTTDKSLKVQPRDFYRDSTQLSLGVSQQVGRPCTIHVVQRDQNENRKINRDPLHIITGVQRFQLPNSGVATECAGFSENETQQLYIGSSGERTAGVLDHFLRRDRKRFFAIVAALNRLISGFEDLDIDTPNPSNRRIDLVIENGLKIHADQASAGVRHLLFFVTLVHHPSPPSIILLEEPENGVHPRRLADVMKLLREITQGKHGGNPAQVILTTHSPYLLDFVNPVEDQVLVFRRCDDGSRTAEPVDTERLKPFLDEFLLGEIWYNQQESGLVAKRPPT